MIILAYALICLVGSVKLQTRTTFGLTILMGLVMLLVVIGGSVYVVHDVLGGNYTASVNGEIIKPTIIPRAASKCAIHINLDEVQWCWLICHFLNT